MIAAERTQTIPAGRKRAVAFSAAYMDVDQSVLLRRGLGATPTSLAKLKPLRLCVLRIDSQHATLDRVSAGALLPLDRGAAGTIILAFEDGMAGEKYDRARAAFSAVSYGERDPDCAGIASPVFGADRKLAGALSVSGPRSRFTDDNVKAMVAAGAAPGDDPPALRVGIPVKAFSPGTTRNPPPMPKNPEKRPVAAP